MKIAVVSHLLPPWPSGQAMMLYRLLRDVNPADYCLITSQDLDGIDQTSDSKRLPAKYFPLSSRFTIGWEFRPLSWRDGVNMTFDMVARARQIAGIVRRERCDAVLSCSSGNDLLDVPSGFLASWLAGVPFHMYLFDTYAHMWTVPRTRWVGKRLEPFIAKRADGVITTNEFVRDLLLTRYGVKSVVIHNPCDLSAYENIPDPKKASGGEVKLVYTGAIYDAHYEAFWNLFAAIGLLGRPEVKAHVYTGMPISLLEEHGIRGPVVYHEHESVFAMPGIQRAADVLFLPLAFNTPYPELIKVSSPSKVGEYLAARRPILVHAPPDSFLANYFREHECGLVVDENDPRALARGVERILGDQDLRQRLSRNAWECAQADFSLQAAQSKFAELFALELKPAHLSEAGRLS
jgi:glycosyltransferase involved in cell wall biosynthesis